MAVMGWIRRSRALSMRLPQSWGLGQADIHSSLLIALGLLSLGLILLSVSRDSLSDLKISAITVPIIWILSLAVRIASQHLSIGCYAHDTRTILGPAGNLATDYEFLPRGRVFAYSLAGQLATAGLTCLGVLVVIGLEPSVLEGHDRWAKLLDFKSGWNSTSLANQIMWVNLLIAGINVLPTVPFDMRATLFAIVSGEERGTDPRPFQRMAAANGYFAVFVLGVSVTLIAGEIIYQQSPIGWYAPLALAVYFFVASRWENARAYELQRQYATEYGQPVRSRSFAKSGPSGHAVDQLFEDEATPNLNSQADEETSFEPTAIDTAGSLEIDDILRKLHREGRASLSIAEQEALLHASRELKSKKPNESIEE